LISLGGPLGWAIFGAIVVVALVVDLGIFHRRAHVVTMREAAVWSSVWIGLALLFNLGVFVRFGSEKGLEFFQAWLIEEALSVDNLFVFLAAFTYFGVPPKLQHRVLFWGILGALITRGIFIALGAALLANFHFVTYLLGGILILTGLKLLGTGSQPPHPEKNPVLKLLRRLIRITPDYVEGKFFVRRDGITYATPLFMVLIVIESADVVFAVDSIPAVFGVTRDVFIVYTSNIFAVLGLRALCFVVADLVRRLRYLNPALALVLSFVGVKMLIQERVKIPNWLSLTVVGGLIVGASVLSLIVSSKEPTPPEPPLPEPPAVPPGDRGAA
jgi:tellurite resistance protein TerC